MLFDFDRFTITVKLAYRRCNGSAYSLEDVLEIFRYYFETYELSFGKPHPNISIAQATSIIQKMPYLTRMYIDVKTGEPKKEQIDPVFYPAMIDQHFVTNYHNCDYNINHFFAGYVRNYRYAEVW